MTAPGHRLADLFVEMTATHDPDLVGRFTYPGTHTGDLLGIPASGASIEMRSIDIWRVQDGRFAEHRDQLNLMQLFRQIGALPPLGAAGARA